MNKKQIIERIDAGLKEMYDRAESAFPTKFTWLEATNTMEKVPDSNHKQFPYFAFYLPEEAQVEIVKRARRYTRHSWRWPRRTEMDGNGHIIPDPEWDEHIKAREEMCRKLDAKEIKLAEYNRWMEAEAKKYGMIRRNYNGEQISFNIMNYAPTTDERGFKELKRLFLGAYTAFNSVKNRGKSEFEYVTEENYPHVTEQDINEKLEENREMVRKIGADPSEGISSALTDPEYVKEYMTEQRKRHIKYLNRVLWDMCLFWAAADQK